MPPASDGCRWSISSKTTATRSRCRSKSRPPAATSRGWSHPSPGSWSRASTAPTSSPAIGAMTDAVAYARARQRPGARAREGDSSLLPFVLRRREAVQDGGRADGGSEARSYRPARRASSKPRDSRRGRTRRRSRRTSTEVNAAADQAIAAPTSRRPTRRRSTSIRRTSIQRRTRSAPPPRPRASRTRWSPRSIAR